MLVRPPVAEQQLALEVRFEVVVVGDQEGARPGRSGLPADPLLDRLGDGQQGRQIVAAQNLFQLVQLGDPIGVELRLAEAEGGGGRIAPVRKVLGQRTPRGLDDPGAGKQVADPHAVAVDKKEKGKEQRPHRPNRVVSVSAKPSCAPVSRNDSGSSTSISRIRLRATTWSIDRPEPSRETTRMPTMRLPGVAPRLPASKAMK